MYKLFDSNLTPEEAAHHLENSQELEDLYRKAAFGGSTSPPENAEDEVDYHYVCFVRWRKNGRIYELDGDKKGPVDTGVFVPEDQDMLGSVGRSFLRDAIHREGGDNFEFSLMALVAI